MRRARTDAGVSLRVLERAGTWRRSTMSQVETAKAHPSRELVAWYDEQFHSDGLLLSIYAEARSRQLLGRDGNGTRSSAEGSDDAVRQVSTDPPDGATVGPAMRVACRVTLTNIGARAWKGCALRRMGAYAGGRLLSSAEQVPIPDTASGDTIAVAVAVDTPDRPGTVVAYWSMVDARGREVSAGSQPISMRLTVR